MNHKRWTVLLISVFVVMPGHIAAGVMAGGIFGVVVIFAGLMVCSVLPIVYDLGNRRPRKRYLTGTFVKRNGETSDRYGPY